VINTVDLRSITNSRVRVLERRNPYTILVGNLMQSGHFEDGEGDGKKTGFKVKGKGNVVPVL